jgi:hypothetical protein
VSHAERMAKRSLGDTQAEGSPANRSVAGSAVRSSLFRQDRSRAWSSSPVKPTTPRLSTTRPSESPHRHHERRHVGKLIEGQGQRRVTLLDDRTHHLVELRLLFVRLCAAAEHNSPKALGHVPAGGDLMTTRPCGVQGSRGHCGHVRAGQPSSVSQPSTLFLRTRTGAVHSVDAVKRGERKTGAAAQGVELAGDQLEHLGHHPGADREVATSRKTRNDVGIAGTSTTWASLSATASTTRTWGR